LVFVFTFTFTYGDYNYIDTQSHRCD